MHPFVEVLEKKQCDVCGGGLRGTYVVLSFVNETEKQVVSNLYCISCFTKMMRTVGTFYGFISLAKAMTETLSALK